MTTLRTKLIDQITSQRINLIKLAAAAGRLSQRQADEQLAAVVDQAPSKAPASDGQQSTLTQVLELDLDHVIVVGGPHPLLDQCRYLADRMGLEQVA